MKKLIILILILVPAIGFSQNSGTIVLDWSPKNTIAYNSFEVKSPQFTGDNFQFDLGRLEIKYNKSIPQNGFVDENSLKITNIQFETIEKLALGDLSVDNIPDAISVKLMNIQSRDDISASFSLSPIIKDGAGFKKVISFDYSFVNGNQNRQPSVVNAISNSVLVTGNWYRFYVQTSGAYFIDKNFLQQLGIQSGFDPRNLKIYGGGGRMLPLANNVPYPIDLPENAIQVNGENDGVFDDNDSVIFYAEGVDNWSQENGTFGNLYEDKSYYYITVDGDAGKRIPDMVQPSGSPLQTFTTFDSETFYEKDIINIGRLGRRWFGENFSINNVQTFNFNIPNIVPGSQMSISVTGAAVSSTSTNFSITANGTAVSGFSIGSTGAYTTHAEGTAFINFPATENLALKLTYNNQGVPTAQGYLDYISIKSKRNLVGYGKQFRFQNNSSAVPNPGFASYQISNASAVNQVWNITDIYNVTKASNNGQATFAINSNLGSLQKFIAIDNSNLFTPLTDGNIKVSNQNLKGTIFKNVQGVNQDIDYLIIAPDFLTEQAERLADFHRTKNSYNVKVVTLESIYPEFSSGKQDIGAIRNFVKYVYQNNTAKKLQFLNMFGGASYDYKNNNNRTRNNTNIVPIYQATNSFSLGEASFCSDDFYGLMDANEGAVDSTFYKGIGRAHV